MGPFRPIFCLFSSFSQSRKQLFYKERISCAWDSNAGTQVIENKKKDKQTSLTGFPLFPGHRLWQLVLRAPTGLHLHPVKVLPRPGGHPGRQVRHAHRHVELGMHPGGAPDRLPPTARRRWGRSVVVHNRASGNAAAETSRPEQKSQKFHQLQRWAKS